MRITFLTHFPGRGGSTVFLQQLRGFFERRGHPCEVVCGMDDPSPLLDRYHVVPVAIPGGWRARRRRYLECVRKTSPDVVYAISGREEFDILRFLPLPRAHHIFSLERHPWTDIPLLIRKSALYTELFTANTPDVLESIQPLISHSEAQVSVAPYRMDPLWFAPRRLEPSSVARVRICFCARLESHQKRADWLAEIIPAAQRRGLPLEWHIIGDGPCASFINKRLIKCNIPITFHGWLPPAKIRCLYELADLFFLCSRWEGLPVAMVEAMASGLACVVPRIPSGIVHMLGDGRGGWTFDATSPHACVEALELACSNREILTEKKRLAAHIAKQMYSEVAVETQLWKLEEALQRIVFNGSALEAHRAPRLRNVSPSAYLSRAPVKFFNRFRK